MFSIAFYYVNKVCGWLMAVSMTGYGNSKLKSADLSVMVEMKSVNHRFSEFQIRMPRQLMKIEDKIRKKLASYIKRGRVEVFITIEGKGLVQRTLQPDWQLIDEFVHLVKEAAAKYSMPETVEWTEVLSRPDFIEVAEKEEENETINELILEAVGLAAEQLYAMRQAEGEELKKDLSLLLSEMEKGLSNVKALAPAVVEAYRERLERRMQELASSAVDKDRLEAEAAIFAEKSDIHEECVRLESHIQQFRRTLELDEPIGRKLDFLIQEMNREANTIGSKANDSKISSSVVELKTSLEKMKEQVQNIE
ncbi:Protein YicC [Bacillus thermotolerans]|nr:Protein YicC [Bacillus thermotolerans]